MSTTAVRSPAKFDCPDAALAALVERLTPVGREREALSACTGRILAEPLIADRPSPPCDVSAMDGYAVRLADLSATSVPVAGEAPIGQPPLTLPLGSALRILTGSPLPRGAEAVVPREVVDEGPEVIRPRDPQAIVAGQHIRRAGENIAVGGVVLEAGRTLTPACVSAAAAFGASHLWLQKKLRVAVIVTGDELIHEARGPQPWELRDSNGPALASMIGAFGWAELLGVRQVVDDPDQLCRVIDEVLSNCDALLLTGGVSMGVHDHVPDTVRSCGAEVVFHRLPIRPGKPVLGAVGREGQVIFGLPGNPVSALVTARRLAIPALLTKAGGRPSPPAEVRLGNPDDQSLNLHWFRLVELVAPGWATLIENRGSGDLVAAARNDGFVEQLPGEDSRGPLAYFPWGAA